MKILSVGLLCVDVISYVDRFPAEDSDNRCSDLVWTTGGNATNICKMLKQLGAECHLFASFGAEQDDFGSRLARDQLTELSIDFSRCVFQPNEKLSTSSAIVNTLNGTRTILHYNAGLTEPTFREFERNISLSDYDAVYFEGRNISEMTRMVKHVVDWKKRTSTVKPLIALEIEKPRLNIEDFLIPGLDCVFISKDYSKRFGFEDAETACVNFADKFSSAGCSAAHIFCPWGDRGAAVCSKDRQVFKSPANKSSSVTVIDTLGAGDTFIAGCLYELALNSDAAESAVNYGCRLAGIKCTMKGFNLLNAVEALAADRL